MLKKYLLTPGPTPIPDPVRAALAHPIIHHRTPEFEKLFSEIQVGLKKIFQTQQTVITLAATGTGAMDAAVSNLFCKGDKVIVINAGKFGERWSKIAKAYGLIPAEIRLDPLNGDDHLDPRRLEDMIRAHRDAKAILFQASETSSGIQLPSKEIARIARASNMLSVCDGITACGIFELPMDEWGIDVLITGSQKAMMIPPGLAFIALSARAWDAAESSGLPHYYFDLKKERILQEKNQTAWSPATSLLQGLHESLRLIFTRDIEETYRRHALLAKATRAAVKALGLELLARHTPSPAVTAVRVPQQILESAAGGKAIPKLMREKHGVIIAGGQGEFEGKIFRLSHFGYCEKFDITTGIAALELVLHELGFSVKFGCGVGAALEVLSTDD